MQYPSPQSLQTFRICSYLHLVCLCIDAVFQIILSRISFDGFTLLTFIYLILLAWNAVLHLNLLNNYYPAKEPGKKQLLISGISALLAVLLLILFFFPTSYGLYISMTGRSSYPPLLVARLLVFILILITGFYIFFYQFKLKKALRRNARQSIDRFLQQEE